MIENQRIKNNVAASYAIILQFKWKESLRKLFKAHLIVLSLTNTEDGSSGLSKCILQWLGFLVYGISWLPWNSLETIEKYDILKRVERWITHISDLQYHSSFWKQSKSHLMYHKTFLYNRFIHVIIIYIYMISI